MLQLVVNKDKSPDLDLTSAYDYELPEALIATQPSPVRTDSRLMALLPGREPVDAVFASAGVDAQLALAKVRLERLSSVYNFDVALARLLEASGQSELFREYQQEADVEVRL